MGVAGVQAQPSVLLSAGAVRASSVFPILSVTLLFFGGLCVAASEFHRSRHNVILSAGIFFVSAGEYPARPHEVHRHKPQPGPGDKAMLFRVPCRENTRQCSAAVRSEGPRASVGPKRLTVAESSMKERQEETGARPAQSGRDLLLRVCARTCTQDRAEVYRST